MRACERRSDLLFPQASVTGLRFGKKNVALNFAAPLLALNSS